MRIGKDLPPSLVDAAAKIIKESSEESAEVAAFVKKELEALGAKSPAELTDAQRKELFSKVDQKFKGDKETKNENKDCAGKKMYEDTDIPPRFFQVEVLNGATGDRGVYHVAAPDRMAAEAEALMASKQEADLFRPHMGGNQVVVDACVEISEDEYNRDDEIPERDANKPG